MEFEKEQVWEPLSSNGEHTPYCVQATDSNNDSFKTWVKSLLQSQAVLVEFIKADGDTRVMKCTLSTQLGARHVVRTVVESEDTAKPARKLNTDACAVWDLNQSAWRSFRWDRMKKIEVLAETDSIPVASTT